MFCNSIFFKVLILIFPLFTLGVGFGNESWDESKLLLLNDVWSRVDTAYYDETFGGLNWDEVRSQYEERLPEIETEDALRDLLRDMLMLLGDSHFAIVQGEFTNLSNIDEVSGVRGDVGIELTLIENDLYVFRLAEMGVASESGLKEGMRVDSVAGKSFDDLRMEVESYGLPSHLANATLLSIMMSRFMVAAGDSVEVVAGWGFKKLKEYSLMARPFEGELSDAFGHLPAMPIEFEGRDLGDGVSYMRFNLWLPALMKQIRPYITTGLEDGCEGLIIDIRGNPGGIGLMATGVAGLLLDDVVEMGTMTLRSGHLNLNAYPQKKAFLGPVAVLVDSNSLSTSEIFAAAMQEKGRVRVFGERSSGATLPSQFVELINGDVMQMPMANYETADGTQIEERGVVPDVEVVLSPKKLKKGVDAVVEAAKSWLLKEAKTNK